MVGNAGSGKSAIMAKSAHDAVEKSHNSTEINFPGYVMARGTMDFKDFCSAANLRGESKKLHAIYIHLLIFK